MPTRSAKKKLLRIKDVGEKTGLSASSIYKLIKQGRFPKGIRLTGTPGQPGVVRWDEADIDSWIETRKREAM